MCLGFEPVAAGWKTPTNTLSYGGTPYCSIVTIHLESVTISGYIPAILTQIKYHSAEVAHSYRKKLKYNKKFHISFNQSIDSGNANWRDGSARTRNSKPPIWSVVIAHLQQQQHHLHQQQNHHRQQQLQHRHWRQHKDTHDHANLPLGACYVTNSRYSGKRFHDPYLVNANLQPKLKGTPSHSKKLQFTSKIVELTVGKLRLMTGQEN